MAKIDTYIQLVDSGLISIDLATLILVYSLTPEDAEKIVSSNLYQLIKPNEQE